MAANRGKERQKPSEDSPFQQRVEFSSVGFVTAGIQHASQNM